MVGSGRAAAFCALALLGSAAASALTVDFADSSWKQRPITKVIGLLKDMQNQLTKEAKEDEDMYDKLVCWCDTNEKEKSKAIADGTAHIESLKAAIESGTAKSSQLDTEIEKLNAELAKNQAALDQATEIRAKESSEFQSESKDMTASATSLSGAVEALGKAQGGAALTQESLMQIKNVLRHHMQKHKGLSLIQEHTLLSSAQPQSGAIFGVLKQMKEEFETNIANAKADEDAAAAAYTELKSAKEKELGAGSDLSDSKSVELANTQDKLAQDKQDQEDTEATLAADTKFLENVRSQCKTAGSDYEARQKVRGEEIKAVGETIGILTDDESQQAFSKSQSFIQLSLRTRRMSALSQEQEKASRLLRAAAKKSGSAGLLRLSTAVKGPKDAIKKVVKQIDVQIEELKKIQKEEVEQHEYCTAELKENAKSNKAKTKAKADLEQLIADLSASTRTLSEEIASLQAQINDANVEMKRAGENREKENADFQVTVQDQKATQVILNKALDRLKSFYDKKAFMQTVLDQTPPAQGSYKKSGGASAVVMMIESIIDESKDVQKKALNAENEAQADYEQFMKDSMDSNNAANQDITNKSEAKAKADKDKIQAEGDLKATINDLLKLGEVAVALHQDCDFLIKNYEVRQSSRAEEMDALFNAKSVLSGAKI